MRKIMSDVHIFLASEPLQNKCDTVKHTSFLCVSPFLPFVKHGLNKETSAETPDEPKSGKDKYKYQGHVWRCRIPRVSVRNGCQITRAAEWNWQGLQGAKCLALTGKTCCSSDTAVESACRKVHTKLSQYGIKREHTSR